MFYLKYIHVNDIIWDKLLLVSSLESLLRHFDDLNNNHRHLSNCIGLATIILQIFGSISSELFNQERDLGTWLQAMIVWYNFLQELESTENHSHSADFRYFIKLF